MKSGNKGALGESQSKSESRRICSLRSRWSESDKLLDRAIEQLGLAGALIRQQAAEIKRLRALAGQSQYLEQKKETVQ